jgi:hypothetical protein
VDGKRRKKKRERERERERAGLVLVERVILRPHTLVV